MKNIILFITTLLFIQQGITKEETSDLSYVSENGEFKVHCQHNDFCKLNVNGLDVSTQFPYMGESKDFISAYSSKDKGLYLLKLYHGDGCPNMYRFLHLFSDKKHDISESFGNCNEFSDFGISLVKNQATIQFSVFKEAAREAISYTYSLSKHELKQEDNCD